MNFELTFEEINLIMVSLGRMPYESVFQLVEKLKSQATPQLQQLQQEATPPM
jgi:hypothetical protein